MTDQPIYRVIWILNANEGDEQAKLNEMAEQGYDFVQSETVYARSKGSLITKLVFELRQPNELELNKE